MQRRLAAAGWTVTDDEPATFGPATRAAVLAFQHDRGLHGSGECDEATWLALVEAGWTLGDRLLLLDAPHLRGDDVSELQTALNQLGFDCGRPDGILGPATVRALQDFQHNSGLTADGICGPRSLQMLERVRRQSGSGPGVAAVRERQGIAPWVAGSTLRVVIGQFGGLSSIARAVSKRLRDAGAVVMSTDEYEASAQAAAANRFGASVYVGFEPRPDECSLVAYFAVPAFESAGGRELATRIVAAFHRSSLSTPELRGMRLAVLRETRMPAVVCSLGPVRDVVDATEEIAGIVTDSVVRWASSPSPGGPVDVVAAASDPG